MAPRSFELTKDLVTPLEDIAESDIAEGASPRPVDMIALYLHELAKSFGLSESVDEDPLERARLASVFEQFVAHYLPEISENNADALTDRLYRVFLELSKDPVALKTLNKRDPISGESFLRAAQIYWNIEATATRKLPISPKQVESDSGRRETLGIPVPGTSEDFARMDRSDRVNVTGDFKATGQAFRNQGARIAVLAAQRIVRDATDQAPTEQFTFRRGAGSKPKMEIHLPDQPAVTQTRTSAATKRPVVVGSPREVGLAYQVRAVESDIVRAWEEPDRRRVFLLGAPGFGKSHIARRVWEQSLAGDEDDLPRVAIWVDSADADTTRRAFSLAFKLWAGAAAQHHEAAGDPAAEAHAMLGELANADWPWLVVLDNADIDSLFGEDLLPTGNNPNGRVLVTTNHEDSRISRVGQVFGVGVFSQFEAESYVLRVLAASGLGDLSVNGVTDHEFAAFLDALGNHPLALSIATATIAENHLNLSDWLSEFNSGGAPLDQVASSNDPEGYPYGVAQAWRIALERASAEFSEGVVQRAAVVSALLDPHRQPTAIWDNNDLCEWVGGGKPLERAFGMPNVVKALIAYGVLNLDANRWKDGSLSIHKLAARAVLDSFTAADPEVDNVARAAELIINALSETSSKDYKMSGEGIAHFARLAAVAGIRPRALAKCLQFSAEALAWAADYAGSLAHAEQLLEITQTDDDTASELPWVLQGLAQVHRFLGNFAEAKKFYDQAFDVAYRELNEYSESKPEKLARLHGFVAEYFVDHGRQDEARIAWEKHVECLKLELNESPESSSALRNIAAAYEKLGDLEKSGEWYEKALEIARSGNSSSELFMTLLGYSSILPDLGKGREAREFRREAIAIAAEQSNGQNFWAVYVAMRSDESSAAFVPDSLPAWMNTTGPQPSAEELSEKIESYEAALRNLETYREAHGGYSLFRLTEKIERLEADADLTVDERVTILQEAIEAVRSNPVSLLNQLFYTRLLIELALARSEAGCAHEAGDLFVNAYSSLASLASSKHYASINGLAAESVRYSVFAFARGLDEHASALVRAGNLTAAFDFLSRFPELSSVLPAPWPRIWHIECEFVEISRKVCAGFVHAEQGDLAGSKASFADAHEQLTAINGELELEFQRLLDDPPYDLTVVDEFENFQTSVGGWYFFVLWLIKPVADQDPESSTLAANAIEILKVWNKINRWLEHFEREQSGD